MVLYLRCSGLSVVTMTGAQCVEKAAVTPPPKNRDAVRQAERVAVKSPVRENRLPGSVRGDRATGALTAIPGSLHVLGPGWRCEGFGPERSIQERRAVSSPFAESLSAELKQAIDEQKRTIRASGVSSCRVAGGIGGQSFPYRVRKHWRHGRQLTGTFQRPRLLPLMAKGVALGSGWCDYLLVLAGSSRL